MSDARTTPRRAPADVRRETARELVLRHGWGATAYQTLNAGLEHWFAPGHDAVVAFVRAAGVRVVAGAPVAAAGEMREVARAFERDARAHGERVCYFGVEARLRRSLAGRGGASHVTLGGQPVWDPRGWEGRVRDRRSLRAQLSRARNKGVRIERWHRPAPARLRVLLDLQDGWLTGKGLPRLHFLTAPDALGALSDRRLFVATLEGRPVAFLVGSPVPTRDGWLVEQIVRAADAPNGTSELLIDAIMRDAAAGGSRYLTLGLAPLAVAAACPSERPARWLRWTFRWARAHGRRFYDFAGLEAFKAKLGPDRWDPVYAITGEGSFTPRTLYAIAGAFGGGSPLAFAARALARAARVEAARLTPRVPRPGLGGGGRRARG